MTVIAAPPRTRTRPRHLRSALAALAVGGVLALASAPAYAHDELKTSSPLDGATLAQPPSEVVLTFEEPPVELGAQVVVTGPDGAVSSGSPRLDGDDVVQTLTPGAPAGRYTVEWRVTSDDGHPVSGSFAFTATASATASATQSGSAAPSAAAASPSTAPADAARREPLIPSWAWIIAGVIVIGAAIRLNRRAKHEQRED